MAVPPRATTPEEEQEDADADNGGEDGRDFLHLAPPSASSSPPVWLLSSSPIGRSFSAADDCAASPWRDRVLLACHRRRGLNGGCFSPALGDYAARAADDAEFCQELMRGRRGGGEDGQTTVRGRQRGEEGGRLGGVAFYGDKLYGITPEEELVALDLAEGDKGAPIVTKCRRVIKRALADGEEDHRSWMYDDNIDDEDDNDEDDMFNDDNDNDDNNDDSDDEQEDSFNGDGLVPSGVSIVKLENKDIPYDVAIITRCLVHSSHGDGDGELLLVRHRRESCPRMGNYTVDVDIFKADIEAGNWVRVNELGQGETLFLSRSFSKSIRAYRDIKEGFVYYTYMYDVFDTKSRGCSLIRFPKRWEGANENLLTWLFPPELQL